MDIRIYIDIPIFIPENCFLNETSEYDTMRLLVQIPK